MKSRVGNFLVSAVGSGIFFGGFAVLIEYISYRGFSFQRWGMWALIFGIPLASLNYYLRTKRLERENKKNGI